MFDPNAYENMKVVIEGIVYDHDLNGDILIIERNDLVNLANMSRSFSLVFILKNDKQPKIETKLELSATLFQMAAEWYPINEEPGANFRIVFKMIADFNEILHKRIDKYIRESFSKNYTISWTKTITHDSNIYYQYELACKTILTENEMDEISLIMEQIIDAKEKISQMIRFA